MNDDDTSKMDNAKVTLIKGENASLIEHLYPTLYKFSCILDLRFFPFDNQACKMTFGSWIYDMEGIDYHPHIDDDQRPFGTYNCIENEGWKILGTKDYLTLPGISASIERMFSTAGLQTKGVKNRIEVPYCMTSY